MRSDGACTALNMFIDAAARPHCDLTVAAVDERIELLGIGAGRSIGVAEGRALRWASGGRSAAGMSALAR